MDLPLKIPIARPTMDHRPKTETPEPIRAHGSTPDTTTKSGSHAASFPSIVQGVKFFHEKGNMLGQMPTNVNKGVVIS